MFPLTESGEEADQRSSLEEFLDQAALESGDHQQDGPAVQMMTLHSAKGLEFPLVFMAGMEEGLFPNMRSAEEPGRMEEERRLAYVGITRAMKQLYLTHAESRRMRGMETHNRPSRFLQEVPQETVEEVRLRGEVAQRFRPGARQGRAPAAELDVDGIRIGAMVAASQVWRRGGAAKRRRRRPYPRAGELCPPCWRKVADAVLCAA